MFDLLTFIKNLKPVIDRSYQKRSLLTLLIIFPAILNSQTISDSLSLNVIEISAARKATFINEVPASVNVLEKEQIQELKQTISIDEAMRQVPGIFVNNRYNFSQGERISIRGLGSRAQYGVRSIKVLLDGIPMTFPDGTTQLNNLDLASIGRIEVLRGPASSLYGNAAGGVLAFYTENPELGTTKITPRVTIGSDGLFKLNTKFTTAAEKTQLILSASATDYDGYREFSNSRLYNLNGVLKWFPDETTIINLVVNAMHAPYMYNPGGVDKLTLEEDPTTVRPIIQRQVAGKEVTQAQAGVHIKKGIGAGELNSTIFTINRSLYNPIFGRIIDVERFSIGTRNTFSYDVNINDKNTFSVSAGFEYEIQVDERNEFENEGVSNEVVAQTPIKELLAKAQKGATLVDQKEQINVVGIFGSAGYDLNEKFLFTSSLRYDRQIFNIKNHLQTADVSGKITFDQVSPSLGLLYRIDPNYDVYLNFSTAFQTPTANEFSNDPLGTGFNSSLLPERIKSIESGLRKGTGKLKAEVAGFYFVVENQLIPYQVSTTSDETFYRNAGRTRNLGAELWLKYEPEETWLFRFNYTIMNYVFSDYLLETAAGAVQLEGNKVPGVPTHKIFGGIKKEFNFGLIAEIDLQYIGEYYANDFNGPAPSATGAVSDHINDAYFITDLKMGFRKNYKKIGFLILGGINNIFNTGYSSSIIPNAAGNRYFEPAPGRNFYIGLEIPLKLSSTRS